jgi:hypothetical protein
LNSDFSQRLLQINEVLQPAVDEVVEDYWQRLKALNPELNYYSPGPFLTLPGIRRIYKSFMNKTTAKKPETQFKFDLFLNILKSAQADAERMGAKIFFVYIPDCMDDSYQQNIWKARLLNEVSSFGIAVIDTESPVKAATNGGKTAYFYCPGSHFAPAGAKAAAAEISKRIAASIQLGKP